MADLDDREKRASSVGVLLPWQHHLPLPDSTVGQADRQQTAWSYSGIAAGSPVAILRWPKAGMMIQPGVAA